MPAVRDFDVPTDDLTAVPSADAAERAAAVNALRHPHQPDREFLQRMLDGLRRL